MTLVSEARAATGLTQREFAAIVGVDPSQIGHWASGRKRVAKAVSSLMVVIKAMPAEAVAILAEHHGVKLKGEVSAALNRAGSSPAVVQRPVEEVDLEEADLGEAEDGFRQLDSGYLVFPDRGIVAEFDEDDPHGGVEPSPEPDDAGFAGDGGPPPGRAQPGTEEDRAYGPNRRGDTGKRRAVDEQVPDYTPEFGYTGGQEPPGGGP